MIWELKAWYKQWRKRRELVLEAHHVMRKSGYAPASFEEIELYLLQLGVSLVKEAPNVPQKTRKKLMEIDIRELFDLAENRKPKTGNRPS